MKNSTLIKKMSKSPICFALGLIVALFALDSNQVQSSTGKKQVKCKVELERSVLPAEKVQKSVLKVSLDAMKHEKLTNRPRINLGIALDRSGSMAGEKLRRAKDAAIEALTRLDGRDMFSLVVYDDNIDTIVPARDVKGISSIVSKISEITAGNSTALFGGVSQAAAEVRKNIDSGFVNRIILLSDGLANVGPKRPEDLGRLGAALAKEEISVTTIGVGTGYNEDLMTRLAQRSDGNAYFVEKADDLPGIFKAELGDVLNIVAKNVELTIICPDGVKPIKTIGRDARINGQEVNLSLNQLYGGQQKYVMLEVEISKTKKGENKEIASAKVIYDNAVKQSREEASAKGWVAFSDNLEEINKSINLDVLRDYQITRNAMNQESAIELADKGKTSEAVQTLRESGNKLRNLGNKYNDKKMLQRAKEVETQADELENQGYTKRNRKVMKTDSYMELNQQSTGRTWR